MKSLLLLFSLVRCIYALRSPFQIYWNVPSTTCTNVRPEDHGITTNSGHAFNGDKLVIFYSFGAMPFCNEKQITGINTEESDCDFPVNGGVPQAANLTLHHEQIEADVNRVIPNETFDGLAIIDYEAWRPIYDLNHSSRKVYQRYSEDLIAKRCENCTEEQLRDMARLSFELAAKNFLLATLKRAQELRPNAKWAFWEYPLCNDDAGYNLQLRCSPIYKAANKQLKWLYEASDMLLPKIYLYNFESEVPFRRYHIYAELREAFEVRDYHGLSNLPLYGYAKMEYDVLWNETTQEVDDLFYNKLDTCNSLKYPMELGVDGVIIWSSSFKMVYRCDLMADFLAQTLGPAARIVVDEAQNCSANKCKGKGRCVANYATPFGRCQLGLKAETHCVDF